MRGRIDLGVLEAQAAHGGRGSLALPALLLVLDFHLYHNLVNQQGLLDQWVQSLLSRQHHSLPFLLVVPFHLEGPLVLWVLLLHSVQASRALQESLVFPDYRLYREALGVQAGQLCSSHERAASEP